MATATHLPATTQPHIFSSPAQAAPTATPSTKIARGDTIATLNYFTLPEDGSVPFNWVEPQPEGQPQRNFSDFNVQVPIHDVRGEESKYTLDKDAFLIVQNVSESAEKEWVDDESIKKNYYPEVEKLLLDHVPGSNKVFLFDHTIRRSHPGANRGPVSRVHIDQTPKSAEQRVRLHLPDEAEELLKHRYRIINIWRPINGTVESNPLGFASSWSLKNEDLVPIEHRYPDRTGETGGIRYREGEDGQKWRYLSGMREDERLFLECFDSEGKDWDGVQSGEGVVLGGRVPHTAFWHDGTPAGAKGRESIEVRALVFGP